VAYFLAFHVRTVGMQTLLFILCTVPFWTSNVIRMISWVPLLGRNGLVNQGLMAAGLVDEPVEWLLFSDFSVVLAFVHLYTMFMIVPIFNSMMRIDRSLIEAARDAGASGLADAVERGRAAVPHRHHHRLDLRHHHRHGRLRHHRRDGRPADRLGGQDHPGADLVPAVPAGRGQCGDPAGRVLMIIWGLTRLVDMRKEL
jgi:putative spermidine/putrescine transport system permease protein